MTKATPKLVRIPASMNFKGNRSTEGPIIVLAILKMMVEEDCILSKMKTVSLILSLWL